MNYDDIDEVLQAPVKWAQRENTVLLAICVEELKDVQLTVTSEKISFKVLF